MNHIELFAGCGGLSLGLEAAGFELLLANELSPMAAETFAYNFFDEDVAGWRDGVSTMPNNSRIKWLSSQFKRTDLKNRLREDPRSYPKLGKGECDIDDLNSLKGSLIVGSIVTLNEWLRNNDKACSQLRQGLAGNGVDLVSGGPPCQSFSMAGMREYSNSRNILPMEFANFVKMVTPKMALLENVTGILRPFDVDGRKVYAWFEVAKAFAIAGYVPLCLHVNAKFAGVAQNRPRFLMFLFRHDVYKELLKDMSDVERKMLVPSGDFFNSIKKDPELEYSQGKLKYFDVESDLDFSLFQKSFLSPLVSHSKNNSIFSVSDAIDDLKSDGGKPSKYVKKVNSLRPKSVKSKDIENHQLRQNSEKVRRRFRIYQVIQELPKGLRKQVSDIIGGEKEELSQEVATLLSKKWFVGNEGERIFFGVNDEKGIVDYLKKHKTKKQTQKALDENSPAPAALSIPDDACHYSELRTLSVREMARIQSFPDSFVFKSKVTTGGQMRKFEVPQYTQVGNAVPPILGEALGRVFKELLLRYEKVSSSESQLVA